MKYDARKSHGKGAVAAVPASAILAAVWIIRQFFGIEVPTDVAMAFAAGASYAFAWLRNKAKNDWKL